MSVLTLQPDESSSFDSYIADNHANTNYSSYDKIVVGRRNKEPFEKTRGLIKFDLSSIPSDATITEAKLYLYLKKRANRDSDDDKTIRAHRILKDWNELAVTWNDYKPAVAWSNPGAFHPLDSEGANIGTVTIPLEADEDSEQVIDLDPPSVQDWIDGTLANYGLLLKMQGEANDFYTFHSASANTADAQYRPKLEITYVVVDETIPVNLTEKSQVFSITDGVVLENGEDSVGVNVQEVADVLVASDSTIEWTEDTRISPILLRINKEYKTPELLMSSVDIREELNGINTMLCRLVNPDTPPLVGHEIELLHGAEPFNANRWTHSGLSWVSEINITDGLLDAIAFRTDTSGVGSWLKLTLDLEAPKTFRSCRIYAQGTYTATWDVEFSDDDVNWTKATTGWNSGVDGALSSANWSDFGPHRYWRLYKTDAAVAGSNGVLEVQFSTEPWPILFHGTIDEINKSYYEPNFGVSYELTCVDWTQLLDRRLVVEEYVEILAGDIVKDVVTDHLTGDGVTTAFVSDGPTITKIVANYITALDLFKELAEMTGFWFRVDYDKRIHYSSMVERVAPFNLASGSVPGSTANIKSASVNARTTREQYRNHQFVRAGFDITDVQTETFLGDGQTKTFNVGFPVALEPVVDIDGVVQTIGIRGVDTGMAWYWAKDTNEITQDSSGTALTSAQILKVEYQGLFPVIVEIEDSNRIAERAGVEGGTGVYQNVEDFEHLDGQDIATDKGVALLRKFGRLPTTLNFETYEAGLQAGQLITITIPELNVSGSWLIESISVEDIGVNRLVYRGVAIDGEHLGGWVEFFRKFSKHGGKFTARENEVLQTIQTPNDTVSLTDNMTPTQDSPVTEWYVDTAEVGFSEVI